MTKEEYEAKEIESILDQLQHSKFRSHFSLTKKEKDYVKQKGMETVVKHAYYFIENRLSSAEPIKDGKQTPMRGHPVFIAQHATATCCRGCLEKWHKIKRGRELTKQQQDYIVEIIITWIKRHCQ